MFDRVFVSYSILQNFRPVKVQFKNAVVLLKLLRAFALNEEQREVCKTHVLNHPSISKVLAFFPHPPSDVLPPVSPGCSRVLKSVFLHVQTGNIAAARRCRAEAQGVSCAGQYVRVCARACE